MNLTALSEKYHDFHAPSFLVKADGRELVRGLQLPVSRAEVDMELGTTSRFSFTINDCYEPSSQSFKTGRGNAIPLSFGSQIEISMGYRDENSMGLLLKGVVTEISTNFPENGSPELSVSGYDMGFPLTVGRQSQAWSKAKDSEAVAKIASFHNLNTKIVPTEQKHPQIEQSQESDWAFLSKLAKRNGYELYIAANGTLHFQPPAERESEVVELAYEKGLLSFRPTANLAGQVAAVEVHGWDPKKKEKIIGKANANDKSALKGGNLGDWLGSFVRSPSKSPTLKLRFPVTSHSEANQRAESALKERTDQFLTGEGESIGLPELKPAKNLSLRRIGPLFSKKYRIQKATHTVDNNGYRTRFKVKETNV